MRVYGPTGSADFAYYVGGVQQDYGTATSGYMYVALGDARNTLDVAAIRHALVELMNDVRADLPTAPDRDAIQQFTRTSMAERFAACLNRAVPT